MKKREVQTLIRRRWPKAILRENKNAKTLAEREAVHQRWREINDRTLAIAARFKELDGWCSRLIAAAKFVCDVDGDAPSIEKMKAPLADAMEHEALIEERRDLRKEADGLDGYSRRFEVCENGGGMFTYIRTSGDTLDEIAAACPATKEA